MMYGYGAGWGWMMLMPLLWIVVIVVIVVIVWALARLVPPPGDNRYTAQRRETAQEILDRRFALGEIDAEAFTQARARLAGREPTTP